MTRLLAIVLLAGTLAVPGFGQEEKSADAKSTAAAKDRFYHLDFSVREVDGERTINNREYSMILSNNGESSSIRAGAHVPVNTGGGMWQEINVGVSIDCKAAREIANQFLANIRADITSMAEGTERGLEKPITRNNSWQSEVVAPMRKPTLLFSSDDPVTKRKMQLVLTVTPVL